MTNEEAIEHIKLILLRDRNNELHFVSHDEEIALDLAIKALTPLQDDPHYNECDYCKYSECSEHDYPCCECGELKYTSKWEKIE